MDNYTNLTNEYQKASQALVKLKSDIGDNLKSLGFFIGIIILIVGFILLCTELYTIYKIHAINSWPIIPDAGTIVDSYMENSSMSTSYNVIVTSSTQYTPFYRTTAAFIYRVADNFYLGERSSFNEPWQANAVVSKIENNLLQTGRKVSLRINPKNPSEAYIFNKPYDRYYRFAFALFLFLIGLYIIFAV